MENKENKDISLKEYLTQLIDVSNNPYFVFTMMKDKIGSKNLFFTVWDALPLSYTDEYRKNIVLEYFSVHKIVEDRDLELYKKYEAKFTSTNKSNIKLKNASSPYYSVLFSDNYKTAGDMWKELTIIVRDKLDSWNTDSVVKNQIEVNNIINKLESNTALLNKSVENKGRAYRDFSTSVIRKRGLSGNQIVSILRSLKFDDVAFKEEKVGQHQIDRNNLLEGLFLKSSSDLFDYFKNTGYFELDNFKVFFKSNSFNKLLKATSENTANDIMGFEYTVGIINKLLVEGNAFIKEVLNEWGFEETKIVASEAKDEKGFFKKLLDKNKSAINMQDFSYKSFKSNEDLLYAYILREYNNAKTQYIFTAINKETQLDEIVASYEYCKLNKDMSLSMSDKPLNKSNKL